MTDAASSSYDDGANSHGDLADEVVKITSMSYGSWGVSRLSSGKAVFVDGAVVGDEVLVDVYEDKPRYARGRIARLVEASPHRVDAPACARECGGCSWASLSYESQCEAKRGIVVEALARVARCDHAESLVEACVACDRPWGYRNKLELAVDRNAAGRCAVGFRRQRTHDIFEVDECPLANALLRETPKAIRGVLGYFQHNRDVDVHRVGVRASMGTGEVEVALWTPAGPFPRKEAAKFIADATGATSVVRLLGKDARCRSVGKVEVLGGAGCWSEEICGVSFRVSAPSFFQVNTAQAEVLVRTAMGYLGVQDGMRIADLYAGAGTFSLPMARAGAHVIAVERAGSSTRDLARNAKAYDADIEVVCDDVQRAVGGLGLLDGIVVDPPAAGLTREVVADIARAKPARLVYVSCDPQTWARDVRMLDELGMGLVHVRPVDMFPQTYHVELVSLFEAGGQDGA